MKTENTFPSQLSRLKLATGRRTQAELAEFLGVKQSAVTDAARRGKLPTKWLLALVIYKGVNPEWLLTGCGPCYLAGQNRAEHYETGPDHAQSAANAEALRGLPSRLLADELLRRIAVAQAAPTK